MAVSDLDVGLLTQPMGTLDSRTQTNLREKIGQFRIIKIHTWLGGFRE